MARGQEQPRGREAGGAPVSALDVETNAAVVGRDGLLPGAGNDSDVHVLSVAAKQDVAEGGVRAVQRPVAVLDHREVDGKTAGTGTADGTGGVTVEGAVPAGAVTVTIELTSR